MPGPVTRGPSSPATPPAAAGAVPTPRWLAHRRRGLALAVAVSLASLLALLAVAQRPPGALLATLAGLDPALVGLAVLLHAGLWLAWGARVVVLAGAVGLRIGYVPALRAVLAGTFAASITPSMLGGEAVRGYALAREGARRVGPAGAAILSERLLDMLFFLTGGAAFAMLYGGLFLRGPLGVALAAAGLLMGFGLTMVALAGLRPALVRRWCGALAARLARRDIPKRARWQARAEREFDQFREALRVLAHRPRALLAAAALTAVMWSSELGVLWALLRAFDAPLPFPLVLLAGMLLLLVMTTPLAPGGSGVAELGAMALFGGLSPGLSPLFPAAWRGCTFYLNLLVGGWAAAGMWPGAAPPGEAAAETEAARHAAR